MGDTLEYDDEVVQSAMDYLDNVRVGLKITIYSVGLICNLLALFGAAYFNKLATWVGGMWFLFETIRGFCSLDFLSAGIAICFCYPHAVFYYELKNGVMSRENYPKERICCDCLFTC